MINEVSQIYDSLFSFEKNKDGEGIGYPIHKKLIFTEDNVEDIYQWILKEYEFSDCQEILDAGCGVGFGSLLLAENTGARVTGISVSNSEIQQAKANAAKRKLNNTVDFAVTTFEEAPPREYDLIIAIESLKHSFDLQKSLTSLKSKLKQGGKFIVIEDFYQENVSSKLAKKYALDWSLKDAYRLEDYLGILPGAHFIDLTNRMPVQNKMSLSLKRMTLSFLSWIKGNQNIYKIFRGGIYLDQLYANKKMKYGCLVFQENL